MIIVTIANTFVAAHLPFICFAVAKLPKMSRCWLQVAVIYHFSKA